MLVSMTLCGVWDLSRVCVGQGYWEGHMAAT